jgi:hypothetical protein
MLFLINLPDLHNQPTLNHHAALESYLVEGKLTITASWNYFQRTLDHCA